MIHFYFLQAPNFKSFRVSKSHNLTNSSTFILWDKLLNLHWLSITSAQVACYNVGEEAQEDIFQLCASDEKACMNTRLNSNTLKKV